jgi:hypothetical protein
MSVPEPAVGAESPDPARTAAPRPSPSAPWLLLSGNGASAEPVGEATPRASLGSGGRASPARQAGHVADTRDNQDMDRLTVGQLAKELGVKHNDVMKLASEVGMRFTRVAATLTPNQADRVRAHLAGKRKAEEQRMTRRLSQPPPPRRSAPAPIREEPVPGPPNACSCCGIAIRVGPTTTVARCRSCSDHYAIEGEDEARVLDRLRDHEAAMLHAYRAEADAAGEFEGRMKAALRSRDSWRGALVETALAHEELGTGGCRCGAREFPCFTLNKLEATNRGIARRVETFGAMTDDERDAELYPLGHWDHDEGYE